MITDNIVYIDCETSGLDPDRHEIWELAIIDGATGQEWVWHFPINLANADLIALNIGGYNERIHRCPEGLAKSQYHDLQADEVAHALDSIRMMTWGRHLVGAVPSFDAERLSKLMRAYNGIAAWHYHLIDIEMLAIGFLIGGGFEHTDESPLTSPPWNSDDLSGMVGIERDEVGKHTALGDARWAKEIYEKVMES